MLGTKQFLLHLNSADSEKKGPTESAEAKGYLEGTHKISRGAPSPTAATN